jgi:hypothetical protein
LTVTPDWVPHVLTSFAQADDALYCGYGSQNVYVPPPPADDEPEAEPPEPLEQAVSAAATAAQVKIAAPMALDLRGINTIIPL